MMDFVIEFAIVQTAVKMFVVGQTTSTIVDPNQHFTHWNYSSAFSDKVCVEYQSLIPD